MTATEQPMSTWLEGAWMQRYLARELTPAETEWFEVYVLDKPELLERIETDLDLRDGIAGKSAVATPVVQGRDAGTPAFDGGRRRARRATTWFARAAGVVVSAAFGWWAASTHAPAPEVAAAVIVDPVRIVFDTQRGEAGAPLVFNADSNSAYLLVEVGVPMDASDVRLLHDAQPPRPLTVTSEGFVSFLLPRDGTGSAPPLSLNFTSDGNTVTRTLDLSSALDSRAFNPRALKGDTQ